jgi:UDP-N-acetylglucosamine--N-acetylmuramyl-(pentapeptide) pyrophosphoryl-undecaprenol N-acetylglucosamine transferase
MSAAYPTRRPTYPRAQHDRIVLVAGGTGGHVFPAEALAGELGRRGLALALFTDQRGREWSGALGSIDTHAIPAGRVDSGPLVRRLRGAADIAVGGIKARRLLKTLRPGLVIGFGGYPSVAPMLAATSLNIPTMIHEQNALLGRANRLLAPRVTAIATSLPEVARLRAEDTRKVVFTGNPVRASIGALRVDDYAAPVADGPVRLLVTGGSQGASVFSQVVPAAAGLLDKALRARLHVTQQCRPEDLDEARAAYDALGIDAELAPFIANLAEHLGTSHLVISRAGASTVAELTTAGRPALLVPYPHAADDHQTANALAVAAGGGAKVIPEGAFTAEALAEDLTKLAGSPDRLAHMAEAARASGHGDAAANLAILAAGLVARDDAQGNGREAA